MSTAGQRAADRPHDMAQHERHLGTVRGLAGAQDHRHRLAAGGLVDVDRQEAAAVVVGVEQGQLLLAVNPILGVVDVEHDAARHLLEAVAEQLDHRGHHPLQRGGAGQVLQPAHRRLRAQLRRRLRQPADRQLERRVGAQGVAVVGVRRSRRRSAAHESGSSRPALWLTRCGSPRILDAACQALGDAELPLDLAPAPVLRRPRSAGRRQRRHAPACRRPVTSPAERAHAPPWRVRTPLTALILRRTRIIRQLNGLCRARRRLDELSGLGANTVDLSPDFVDLASPRPELSFPCEASLFARRKTDALCQRY